MIRERLAFLFFLKYKMGLCFIIADDKLIKYITVGVVALPVAPAIIKQFNPDKVILTNQGDKGQAPSALQFSERVEIMYSKWGWKIKSKLLPFKIRKHINPAGRNAWRLAWFNLLVRGDYIIDHINIVEFTLNWIEEHDGKRITS